MKILVVQDWLRSGGTERQSVLLANRFASAGHDTTLLTFRPGGRLDATVAPMVRRRSLQSIDWHLDWFAPGLFQFIESDVPDVTLCMGRMANCWAHAVHKAVADRWPHSAVVCTMRTGKRLPWLFRRSLRVCRHIVANSRDARDSLVREHRLASEKISVIYNSLVFSERTDTGEPVNTARRALRARHGASDSTAVLLCVAMFRPEKNQRELVEIAAGLPTRTDWQLWLAGDGPARGECERLVNHKDLGGRVKFVGFHADPGPLYAAADIAVHASWSESLSNFLIEGQARGLPAVVYDAQGISECFVPDRTGWVVARDDRPAFQNRLAALMNESSEARAARATEARNFARATFDPQRQVQTYLDLFQRLSGR